MRGTGQCGAVLSGGGAAGRGESPAAGDVLLDGYLEGAGAYLDDVDAGLGADAHGLGGGAGVDGAAVGGDYAHCLSCGADDVDGALCAEYGHVGVGVDAAYRQG